MSDKEESMHQRRVRFIMEDVAEREKKAAEENAAYREKSQTNPIRPLPSMPEPVVRAEVPPPERRREQIAGIIANVVRELAGKGAVGAFRMPGYCVVYGKDGYSQREEARNEVDLFRDRLPQLKAEEIAFETDSINEYAWAMLVIGSTPTELCKAIEECRVEAGKK